jgi:hypothetical protein
MTGGALIHFQFHFNWHSKRNSFKSVHCSAKIPFLLFSVQNTDRDKVTDRDPIGFCPRGDKPGMLRTDLKHPRFLPIKTWLPAGAFSFTASSHSHF